MTTTAGPPPVRYVCSKCGGPNVSLQRDRSLLDERYPIGHCDWCTPQPKPRIKKGTGPGTDREAVWETPTRRTVPLVRADLDDPAGREHRRMVDDARRLAKKLHDPKEVRSMSEAELDRASAAVAWLRRPE